MVCLSFFSSVGRLASSTDSPSTGPARSPAVELLEEVLVFALAAADDGRKDLVARPLGERQDRVDDLSPRV